jgi:hypothetical protein
MAWINWDAVITALDGGRLPASGGERRIVRIAASLAAGHPVSLRDALPGLDPHNLLGALQSELVLAVQRENPRRFRP